MAALTLGTASGEAFIGVTIGTSGPSRTGLAMVNLNRNLTGEGSRFFATYLDGQMLNPGLSIVPVRLGTSIPFLFMGTSKLGSSLSNEFFYSSTRESISVSFLETDSTTAVPIFDVPGPSTVGLVLYSAVSLFLYHRKHLKWHHFFLSRSLDVLE